MTEELRKDIEKDIEMCRCFNDVKESENTFFKLKEKIYTNGCAFF